MGQEGAYPQAPAHLLCTRHPWQGEGSIFMPIYGVFGNLDAVRAFM